MDIPEKYKTKKEQYKWLTDNKRSIIQQKKSVVKHADGVMCIGIGGTSKANVPTDATVINAELAINTTLLFDSHDDVHMDGIWNQSLKQKGYTILNQEHKHSFADIIAEGENVSVEAKEYTWKELGYKYEGKTQVLVYHANIHKADNPLMFDRYIKNKVRNHSVEMMYVKMEMGINDPDYKEEFAEWNKVFPLIANKADVEANGYFFSIYEAKHLGGAAVPHGSNFATPTINISEPDKSTHNDQEPDKSTPQNNIILTLIN
jgi:hypothetical protein